MAKSKQKPDNLRRSLLVVLVVAVVYGVYLLDQYLKRTAVSSESEIVVDQGQRVPINIRTRGGIGTWESVGFVHTVATDDNTILSLRAREIDRGRYKYEYEVYNKDNGVTVQLFDGEEVDELEDGENIGTIEGYEGLGDFQVTIDKDQELKYLPYL